MYFDDWWPGGWAGSPPYNSACFDSQTGPDRAGGLEERGRGER